MRADPRVVPHQAAPPAPWALVPQTTSLRAAIRLHQHLDPRQCGEEASLVPLVQTGLGQPAYCTTMRPGSTGGHAERRRTLMQAEVPPFVVPPRHATAIC